MKKIPKSSIYAGILAIVLLAAAIYGAIQNSKLNAENQALEMHVGELESSLQLFSDSLSTLRQENATLTVELAAAQKQAGTYRKQVRKYSDQIDTLEKLTQTDPELLKKYSKVFFLNENYVPENLLEIDTKYLANKDRNESVKEEVLYFLTEMIKDAAKDKITLQVVSGYRSFSTQMALKSEYKVIYGAGTANQFSADQGYSEHQLGTTVDLTSPNVGGAYDSFEKDPAYSWLLNNAYQRGFVLSYPKNNKYYQFEPWHWRFVGVELATKLHDEGKNFYDVDQRIIDSYLVTLFEK